MLKKIFLLVFLVLSAPTLQAQEVFWGFGEDDRELIIPPECDNSLEAEELFETGMRLLDETGYAKQGAPYCLMAAALDNHIEAQYEVARLYHKGILLPKSDLAAYKWATLAALNGHREADLLGAGIEQFMSIQDIEASTKSLTSLIPVIAQNTQERLQAELDKQNKLKAEIAFTKKDIADLKMFGKIMPRTIEETVATVNQNAQTMPAKDTSVSTKMISSKSVLGQARENREERAKPNESIFSQQDLDNAPMPSTI